MIGACLWVLLQAGGTSVGERGVLLRDGREFFPFGVYHVSWAPDPSDASRKPRRFQSRDGDLVRIADARLNAVVASLDPTDEGRGLPAGYRVEHGFLEDAARRGVGVIGEIHLPSMGLLIDAMKASPAILAWTIGDDFNVSKGNTNYVEPEALRKRHRAARERDPAHVTYASGGTSTAAWHRPYGDYAGCVDLVGLQSYPIGNEVDFPFAEALETHLRHMKVRAAQVAAAKMIPIANLQSFAWEAEKPTFPTPSESRNMLYAALHAGARGVLYYAYYDGKAIGGKVVLPDWAPELWAEIGRQAAEVAQIAPFLTAGERTALETPAGLHASLRRRGEERLLLVMSTERTRTLEVKLDLPGGRALESVFRERPAGLILGGDTVTGRVGPEEVHVYRVMPR